MKQKTLSASMAVMITVVGGFLVALVLSTDRGYSNIGYWSGSGNAGYLGLCKTLEKRE